MTTAFRFKRLVRINAATSFVILGLWFMLGVSSVRAQAITEDFANITTLPAAGWFTQNNSVPVGSTGWFQGNSAVFPAQAGAATSYIGANFNNTTGTNTISNWLLTPNRTFSNGDVIKFWTRTPSKNPFPDRLEVRLSLAGASTNVGTGSAGVGDFTQVLLTVNPSLTVGGYPEVWTEFTITISGLAAPTSGRIGFRYFVTNGGPTGANSNYIGIDTFSYTPGSVVVPAADQVLDYNDDGKTDYVVVRNTGGGSGGQVTWFVSLNGGTTQAYQWGLSTDFFVSGDFDGDGKDDVTIWRPAASPGAAFYVLNSSNFTATVEQFGQTGDDPTVVNDYNGDNKDDFAVYRGGASAGQQSVWYYRTTPGGPVAFVPWGQNGDFPNPGDFDGNGTADFSVQRNNGSGQGVFWTRLSTGAVTVFGPWGTSSDLIVPGDYDGDGKTDYCVVRGSGGQIVWSYYSSQANAPGAVNSAWGLSATDFPAQGDYDGDGKTDFAVWRPSATLNNSAFYVRGSAAGSAIIFPFGQQGDYPVANYNTH